jgi:hypothetical protein
VRAASHLLFLFGSPERGGPEKVVRKKWQEPLIVSIDGASSRIRIGLR